jgi:hypothetical protein
MFRKRSFFLENKVFYYDCDSGMRADWILTDEQRINKRLKIEENRRLRQMLYPDSPEMDDVRSHKYIESMYLIFYFLARNNRHKK